MKLLKIKNKTMRAFTLVELLVVVSIVGILGTVIVGVMNPKSHQDNATDTATKAQIENLTTAILAYRELEGKLPEVADGVVGVPYGGDDGPDVAEYISNWPEDFIYYPIDDQNFVIEAPTADSDEEDPEYIVYHSGTENTDSCEQSPCYAPVVPDEPSEEPDPDTGTFTCVDTDGGQDEMADGTVTYMGGTYSDSCSSGLAIEYYCDEVNEVVGELDVACAHGCNGNSCAAAPEPEPLDCVDSDGGADYTTYGYVTYGSSTYSDKCDGTFLYENVCVSNEPATELFLCEYGCDATNNVCSASVSEPVEETYTCTEGKNGITLQSSTETILKADMCYSTASIMHYNCPEVLGEVTIQQVEDAVTYSLCESGECLKNACTSTVIESESSCTDTDGGIYPEIKGSVIIGKSIYTDVCVSGQIIEYYCSSPTAPFPSSINQTCFNDCVDGVCYTKELGEPPLSILQLF